MTSLNHSFDTAALTDGRDAVLRDVVQALEDMVFEDWDVAPSGPIGAQTRLVADLGFASIDLVALLSDIEEVYQRRDWPFEELLMVEGRYVDDLSVGQVVDFLHAHGARR
jgi:acyl carrier protein